MFREQRNVFIALVLIPVSTLSLFGGGYAAALWVSITVNPAKPEVYAGASRIILTAEAEGSDLTYRWKLTGPGKLEGDIARSAIAYIPPDKIGNKSDMTVITVTVTDDTGQRTTASVSFTILPKPEPTDPPPPTPTPIATFTTFKPQGMGNGTKVALGVGAAALGGGIALVVGGGDSNNGCGGVEVGGYCWYLGAEGKNCDQVCVSHGGYHEATRTYAGSDGTDNNCIQVLDALGAPDGEFRTQSGYEGCYQFEFEGKSYRRRALYPTNSWASGYRRACACKE